MFREDAAAQACGGTLAEGAEEVVEEIGGLAFFVAGEVGLDVGDEVGEGGGIAKGRSGVWTAPMSEGGPSQLRTIWPID